MNAERVFTPDSLSHEPVFNQGLLKKINQSPVEKKKPGFDRK